MRWPPVGDGGMRSRTPGGRWGGLVARRFRFIVQANTPPAGSDWPSFAHRVEALGYGGLVMAGPVVGNGLSPLPPLAPAPAAPRTLRPGTPVPGNHLPQPPPLARARGTPAVISP